MIRKRLGANPVPVVLPIGSGEMFNGIIDLIEMKAIIYTTDDGSNFEFGEIPIDMKEDAEKWRLNLLEEVASYDEHLMELYLEGKEIPNDDIRIAIRKAAIDGSMIPTLCGSAFKNKGVQRTLDAVIEYLPSPVDVGSIFGFDCDDLDKTISREPKSEESFSALAFKIMTDPYVGRLTFFRVYSGQISTGEKVFNPNSGKTERVGRLMLMHSNKREERKTVFTGEIAAIVGLKNTRTGDTLCDKSNPIMLESMDFPDPVISIAVEPLQDQENPWKQA
jgi:elongation factor G